MAFVLVQHLSPDHKSMLANLIGRATTMPVLEAENNMPIASNTVYVIPPDATLTLNQRSLHVTRPAPPRERRRPIDAFFSSLAEQHGENAICIVLSGTGSDGTLGLKTIKEHGGLTFAQAEIDHTAKSGMPQSATATGLVDEVMPVEEMAARLPGLPKSLAKGREPKKAATGPVSTRPITSPRSARSCAQGSVTISANTRRRLWSVAFSVGCKSCKSIRYRLTLLA